MSIRLCVMAFVGSVVSLGLGLCNESPQSAAQKATDGEEAAAVDCEYICPMSFWGQWNGVNYYGGSLCDGCMLGGFYGASSNTDHDLGNGCNRVNGIEECLSPITFLKRSESKYRGGIDQWELAEIEEYVGPQRHGGAPGQGQNQADTFNTSHPRGVNGALVREDSIARLTINGGAQYRYFRILKLTHPDVQDRVRYVGQELNSRQSWTWNYEMELKHISDQDPRRAEASKLGEDILIEITGKRGFPRPRNRPSRVSTKNP